MLKGLNYSEPCTLNFDEAFEKINFFDKKLPVDSFSKLKETVFNKVKMEIKQLNNLI